MISLYFQSVHRAAGYAAENQPRSVNEHLSLIADSSTMTRKSKTQIAQGSGAIVLGATVVLLEEAIKQQVTYQIVDVERANASAGRLSVASPLARALIGKEEGDIATVDAPAGLRQYEVLTVRFE